LAFYFDISTDIRAFDVLTAVSMMIQVFQFVISSQLVKVANILKDCSSSVTDTSTV